MHHRAMIGRRACRPRHDGVIVAFILALLATTTYAQPARPIAAIRRVVVVSIDGLRPDLLLFGQLPVLRGLLMHGSYTMWARTVDEGYTVPSHVSMLTGVVPSRHGVTWDNHIEDAYPEVPTLFDLAHRAGYTTALAVGKTKLIVLTRPGSLDYSFVGHEGMVDALDVAREANAFLRKPKVPDVLFVHFGDVDTAGHDHGWGSREQMAALEKADRALGMILDTLRDARLLDSTFVIVTSDHGGAALLHPPEDARSQFIPWIASGPSVREHFDLSSVEGLRIDTMSTFATACALLGLQSPEKIASAPVLQLFRSGPAGDAGPSPGDPAPVEKRPAALQPIR